MTTVIYEPITDEDSRMDEGDDDSPAHLVCHCTEYIISWCGKSFPPGPPEGQVDWDEDDFICPLCAIAVNYPSEKCPWGCRCEECRTID